MEFYTTNPFFSKQKIGKKLPEIKGSKMQLPFLRSFEAFTEL
jgi:hypothetical protein